MPINYDLPDDPPPQFRRPAAVDGPAMMPPAMARINMTVEAARAYLAQYEAAIEDALESIQGKKIETPDDEAAFIDTLAMVKKIEKNIIETRKVIIREPKAFCDAMKKLENLYLSKLKEIDRIGRAEVNRVINERRLEEQRLARAREEAARKLREAEEAEQRRIQAEIIEAEKRRAAEEERARQLAAGASKKAAEEAAEKAAENTNPIVEMPPLIYAPTPADSSVKLQGSMGSATPTGRWKMTEILDFAAVPDEFKMIDEKKINAAIRAGITEIPGLKIEKVFTASIR